MPAHTRTHPRLRFAVGPALLLAGAFALTGHAQPEPLKKPPEPKAAAKDLPVLKLPDGTFLWLGTPTDGTGEKLTLSAQELQKLQEQIDQLKKQLATRKPVAPSGCAVRAKVVKRGEQLVASLKFTVTFQTTAPQTAIALGGRKGFLVAASLDGSKLPVIETTEDGLTALIESPGAHTLILDLETPVNARGARPDLGFEIGLPKAAITTLLFESSGLDVKRVNLTTRTPDLSLPLRPPEVRRVPALDVKHLTATSGQENGYPLGAVESVEVTWDQPATTAQPADQVQAADLDVNVLFTEGVVETTAKIRLRGAAREWKIVTPVPTDLTVDRAAVTDVGPVLPPVVTKPADPNKPVWKVELPAGSSAADWVVTAVARVQRPKAEDPKHRGPFSIGPFTVLDVLRQTGTVRITAGANVRFVFATGPDLRRDVPTGPLEEDVTTALFRLTTGPTGTTPIFAPLFTVQAIPLTGKVAIKSAYRLTLTKDNAGWRVRAEVKVSPVRTEVDTVAVEVPAGWQGLEASPPELVEGVQPVALPEAFWANAAARLGATVRVPVLVKLAAGHRQPFELILTATVPVSPGTTETTIPLPRFPGVIEQEATVAASVSDGLELRGELRGWDGDASAAWGNPLLPASGTDAKGGKAITAVHGRADYGLARVLLNWNAHRPELIAESRADVTLRESQLDVGQQIKLRAPEGLPRQLRFRGPAGASLESSSLPLVPAGSGEWVLNLPQEVKDLALTVKFMVPLFPRRSPDDRAAWKVPVGLFWPTGTTRAEATVRMWSNTASGAILANASPGWRELPIEPAPERDALPALTLASSTADVPLVVEAREAGDGSTVAGEVERTLIQAWGSDDGAISYRARFLCKKWLTAAVEIRLPVPLAGQTPEFLRDGLRVEAVPLPDGGGPWRGYRVPLPEPRPNRTAVIEVRYQLPPARVRIGEARYLPPLIPAMAFVGPVRWHITVSPDSVPLLTAGGGPELRWRWCGWALAPVATGSSNELDAWFRTGEEPVGYDSPGWAVLTAHQNTPGAVVVYRLPQTWFVIACSVTAFLLIVALSRVPPRLVGPVVAVVSASLSVAAVFLPQPAALVAGLSQPGILAGILAVGLQYSVRWYYRRRVTRLPGFTRVRSEPVEPDAPAPPAPAALPGPSTSRNRPAPSSGSAAPAVAEG